MPMKILVPQSLKAQEAKEELSLQLKAAKEDGEERYELVKEAEDLIHVHAEQLRRVQDEESATQAKIAKLTAESKEHSRELQKHKKSCANLRSSLEECEEEITRGRKQLMLRRMRGLWEEEHHAKTEKIIKLRRSELSRSEAHQQEVKEELQQAEAEKEGLLSELDAAEYESKARRKFLAKAEVQYSIQWGHNRTATAFSMARRCMVQSLALQGHLLREELLNLEGAAEHNVDLTYQLGSTASAAERLRENLSEAETNKIKLTHALEASEQQGAQCRQELSEVELQIQETKAVLDNLEKVSADEEGRIAKFEEDEPQLQEQLQKAQRDTAQKVAEENANLERWEAESQSLQEKVKDSQQHLSNLQTSLNGLDSENTSLTGQIEALQKETVALHTSAEQLAVEIEETKKKMHCCIC